MITWRPPVPGRGDVVWAGAASPGRRSALVISPAAYCERTGFVLACDVAEEARGYPFEVVAPDGRGGSDVILSDRIRCLHARAWGLVRVRTLDDDVVTEVLQKVATLIGLSDG